MSKIVITGISGFVGKNISKKLEAKGYEIVGVSRRSNDNCKILDWGDFAKTELDASVYIHLAGKAHDLEGKDKAEAYAFINTELTKRVFKKFLSDASSVIFIYFSSVKAVATTVEGVLKEDDFFQVDNPYGQSKRAAEEYLLSQTLPEGKKLVILRPCMIHGPGNKGNLNLLFKFVEKGVPYPLVAFENQRSFLSISNLFFALEQIITQRDFPSGVYHIADDDALSTKDLVKIIAQAINKHPKLWHLPRPLISAMAQIGGLLHLPLNPHRLQKLTESYVVSNEKIKKALGIERFPVSAAEGLTKTIKSFSE